MSNAAAAANRIDLLMASYWIIDTLLSIPRRPDCLFRSPCHVNVSPKNASLTTHLMLDEPDEETTTPDRPRRYSC